MRLNLKNQMTLTASGEEQSHFAYLSHCDHAILKMSELLGYFFSKPLKNNTFICMQYCYILNLFH